MSTYSHSLTLSDGEITMLESALELMIAKCNIELSKETRAPYLAFKQHAEEVLKRLYDHTTQESGNNFHNF